MLRQDILDNPLTNGCVIKQTPVAELDCDIEWTVMTVHHLIKTKFKY